MEWRGPLNTTGEKPSARKGHSMTTLLNSPIALVYGGEGPGGLVFDDMYALNLDTNVWRRIHYAAGAHPAARLLHTATAVSSTKMVLFGGDIMGAGENNQPNGPGAGNDAWLFELGPNSWRRLAHSPNTPMPRAAHSAVLCRFVGQPHGIYVFGGFGENARPPAIMYRLRLQDWKWEELPVHIVRPDGAEMVTTDPATALSNLRGDSRADLLHPRPRESHAAVWVPTLDALAVLCGEEDNLMSDCWLFRPAAASRPKQWTWQRRALRLGGGTEADAVPPTSGACAFVLPAGGARARVLLWGGINHLDDVNDVRVATMVDLTTGRSRALHVAGDPPQCGGLLFGMARRGNRVYIHDGCNKVGDITAGIETAELRLDLSVTETGPATHFGKHACSIAITGKPLPRDVDRTPLVGPSPSVKIGAKGDVRIIRENDHGIFGSIVLGGKVFKGLFVHDPLVSPEDAAKAGEAIPAVVEAPDSGTRTSRRASTAPERTEAPKAAPAAPTPGSAQKPPPAPAPATAPTPSPAKPSNGRPASAPATSNGRNKVLDEKRRREEVARTHQQSLVDALPDELDRPQKQAKPAVKPIEQGEVITLD